MLIKYPRILMEEAGNAGGGTQAPAQNAAELDAAKARLADYEKREQDRIALEAANAKKAMDADAAKNALAAKEAELAETNKRIADYEKREQERAEKMLANLPKETQERLTKYRDAMSSKAAWYDMIADETQRTQSNPTAPAFGTTSGEPRKEPGYTPSKQAAEFLENNYMGKDTTAWATKTMQPMRERDEATGLITNKFYIDGKTLMAQVKRGPVNNLNRADALQRATGKPGRKHLGG